MRLRDKFWLWGHPEGVYNHEWGNDNESRMTPMECCLYLGIRNTFMVPVGVNVNKRQYNKSFKTLKEVGWECFDLWKNPEGAAEYINDAQDFPNIGSVVLDDFIRQRKQNPVSVDILHDLHNRFRNNDVRPLDMWMVLYTHEFGLDAEADKELCKYAEAFDGIIMWTWKERDVPLIPEKFELFKKFTEGKKRMFGCYLYNFGERKQATAEAVTWQLDWYRERILAGEAEGVVLHTNTMADLDYVAYDAACEWMDKHGDELI